MEQICDGLASRLQDVSTTCGPPTSVRPNGQIKIMDFGLARLGTSEMTRTGMVMGTPHYMSPEQVKGKRADARSDIFSLGAVFYELLTGRKPFDAESLHAVLFQVMEHQPEDVRHWSPEVPNILVQVVDKALSKDPEGRYAHAGEMREALRLVRQVLAGEMDEDHALATLIQPSPSDGDATVVADPLARRGAAHGMGRRRPVRRRPRGGGSALNRPPGRSGARRRARRDLAARVGSGPPLGRALLEARPSSAVPRPTAERRRGCRSTSAAWWSLVTIGAVAGYLISEATTAALCLALAGVTRG
jgi:hypothetical protein